MTDDAARRTMLDAAAPPAGLTGQCACLVAMTATKGFLDAALDRFTELSARQRARMGTPFAFLMLDGHRTPGRERAFSPLDVPGLYELQPGERAARGLLHAKVALLAFGQGRSSAPEAFRVIVTTGNWTETSARHQLELVWTAEAGGAAGDHADRSDVAAASAFLDTLLQRYHAGGARLATSTSWLGRLHRMLAAGKRIAPRRPAPRFIHSLEKSLHEQFANRLRRRQRRHWNIVFCGSGSWERPGQAKRARKPETLAAIEKLAADSAECIAVVEPGNAGALAAWARAARGDMDWTICAPRDPLAHGSRRALHAKYLLAGHLHDGTVTSACVYVGSGNLTRRGFLRSVSAGGNIEAGIVVDVEASIDYDALSDAVFLGKEIRPADLATGAGEGQEDRAGAPLVEVPPVLCARVEETPAGERLVLQWVDDADDAARVTVRWPDGKTVTVRKGQAVPFDPKVLGPTVCIVDPGPPEHEWAVPVQLSSGHFCTDLSGADSFDEALAELLEFPPTAEDESDRGGAADDGSAGDDDEPVGTPGRRRSPPSVSPREYPLHTAMQFLEQLGAHQCGLPGDFVDDWVNHLALALPRYLTPDRRAAWTALPLEFRRVLRAPGFQPRGMTAEQRGRYQAVLERAFSTEE